MKSPKFSWRDALAVLIALVSMIGLAAMFTSEGHIVLSNQTGPISEMVGEYGAKVLPSLQKYSLAFGAILVAVSFSYILLGHEEEISTALTEQDKKKS